MGSAAKALARSAALSKGKLRIGLVVGDVIVGIPRPRCDGGRARGHGLPWRHDLLGGAGIIDYDRGRHATQAGRPVRLAEVLIYAGRVEDHRECGASIDHARVERGIISSDGVRKWATVRPQDSGAWGDMHFGGHKLEPLHIDRGVRLLRKNGSNGSKQTHCKRGPQDTQA
jgi:hypothetical protein